MSRYYKNVIEPNQRDYRVFDDDPSWDAHKDSF